MSYKETTLSLLSSINDKSRDVRNLTHAALCNATMHAVQHGDVSLCDKILDALGKGHDRNLVIGWLKQFGCAKWNKELMQFQLAKARRDALVTAGATLEELLANPAWHEFGKEKSDLAREFDVLAKLQSIVKGFDKAKAEGKPTKNDWAVGAVASLISKLQTSVEADPATVQ